MIKNLTGGTVINYGPTLPPENTAFDGTLFYKTAGTDQGLYIYAFNQDKDPESFGDQTGQMWFQSQAAGIRVDENGATLTENLKMETGELSISCNNFLVVDPTLPMTFINDGDTIWKKSEQAGGRIQMKLSADGVLSIGGFTVWHAGNDTQANAGRLNGQPGTFYQNASNITTGTLNRARLPYAPVHQGGGTNQDSSREIYIGANDNASSLYLQMGTTDFGRTWPIDINGNAATANSANSAAVATNANFATTAGVANAVAWTGVTGRPTGLSGFTNDAGYLTSGGTGFIGTNVNTWYKSSDNLNRVQFVSGGATNFAGPGSITTTGPDTTTTTPLTAQEYTTPGTYSFVVPAGVTTISALTIGGGGGGSGGSSLVGGGGGGGGLRYATSLAVTPGETLTVVVGAGGIAGVGTDNAGPGGLSSIARNGTVLVYAAGGSGGSSQNATGGTGSTISGVISGGNGGYGAPNGGGGGGAGGYTGNGGNGSANYAVAGTAGAGGGGGGGVASQNAGTTSQSGGGGVGIYGTGENGVGGTYTGGVAIGGSGGSGGTSGGNGASGTGATGGAGGKFGGGGGGGTNATAGYKGGVGGGGAVRIIWGTGKAYPSTNTSFAASQATTTITPGTTTTTPQTAFVFTAGTLTAATIDSAGNFVATGDVTAFSDERLKKNVELIPGALGKVQMLRGVTYDRIDTNERGTGVIAQDVQRVLPEAVHQQAFDKMLSVSYGNMVGLLIESIKELKQEVDDLKAEISSLKAK